MHNEVEPQTSAAASKQVTARVLHSTRAAGLPEKGNAFLFNAMEPYRTDGTAILAAELASAGYTVAPGKSGTVSDWMSVKDCGILVFHCHGGEDGGELYALSTPEVQTEALDQKYKTLLDLGDLILIGPCAS